MAAPGWPSINPQLWYFLQNQTAVTVYFSSKQLLQFFFAGQYYMMTLKDALLIFHLDRYMSTPGGPIYHC